MNNCRVCNEKLGKEELNLASPSVTAQSFSDFVSQLSYCLFLNWPYLTCLNSYSKAVQTSSTFPCSISYIEYHGTSTVLGIAIQNFQSFTPNQVFYSVALPMSELR